jgi:hypothetical protein
MNWLNDTFAAHLQERASKEGTKARILVICDNLDAHTYSGFLDGLKALGAERNLLGNSYSFHIILYMQLSIMFIILCNM